MRKNHSQQDTEWGARTLEHKIVEIIIKHTMPYLHHNNFSAVLFSLIFLLSEMIENEPNLIKVLFQNEIIAKLVTWL